MRVRAVLVRTRVGHALVIAVRARDDVAFGHVASFEDLVPRRPAPSVWRAQCRAEVVHARLVSAGNCRHHQQAAFVLNALEKDFVRRVDHD